MDKVYIVFNNTDEIEGVFKTEDDARAYINKFTFLTLTYEEWDVE
jgi:hypothetical protein